VRIIPNELRDKNRIDLAEYFPLDTPLVIYLEPTSLCNFRCKFCPTGHKDLRSMRPNGTMTPETVYNFVEGCKFPKKIRRINFYKDGEPLANKNFPGMVSYICDEGIAEQLWTKTNGALLTPELNRELVDCGLDMIGLSIVGVNAEQVESVSGVKIDYKKYVANIRDLFEKSRGKLDIYAKLANSGLSDKDKERFFKIFEPISDYCGVEGLHGWSNSSVADFKMGTNNSFEGGQSVNKIVCPIQLCAMAINWDGSVSLCNEDWQHVNIVGNVNEESLVDIWNGKRVRNFWKMHLSGQRANSIACRNCDYMCALPDNYDDSRIEMLGRL
jgi:radical SAM protein with 4Fe4S-binding SPASM domain